MKKYLLLMSLSALLVACGENNKKSQPEVKTVETAPKIYQSAELKAEFSDESIQKVYVDYNHLKTALVNSDAEKTQAAAKQLKASLQGFEHLDNMKEAALKIATVSDLETQREAFQYVTEEMINLVGGNLATGNLYLQYCPMAFDGKGAYWLSNEEEIRNPYFGDRMLKCGEVKKVIE